MTSLAIVFILLFAAQITNTSSAAQSELQENKEDVQTALTASLALIEPAILIVMGVVVVTILIALYLPIFSLGQASSVGR